MCTSICKFECRCVTCVYVFCHSQIVRLRYLLSLVGPCAHTFGHGRIRVHLKTALCLWWTGRPSKLQDTGRSAGIVGLAFPTSRKRGPPPRGYGPWTPLFQKGIVSVHAMFSRMDPTRPCTTSCSPWTSRLHVPWLYYVCTLPLGNCKSMPGVDRHGRA